MTRESRPYICVFFRCCRVYQRVYRAAGAARYVGRCPRCLREVEIQVGPSGTDARFFEAF